VARELERVIGTERGQGERVGTKDELRDHFGVAMATMNQAIRLLESRGLVETRPGPRGGVFVGGAATRLACRHLVLEFSSGRLAYAECLEVRDALEPAICSHAGRHRRGSNVRGLRRILTRMSGEDPARYFEANWALHREIADICRNAPLGSLYLAVLEFLESKINQVEIGVFNFNGFRRVHTNLVDAIDDGDPKRLERAVREHRPTQDLTARVISAG
jgi:DNA-binding FadR family transcriptional regulator